MKKRGKQKRSAVYFFTVTLFIFSLLIVSEGAPAGPPTKPDVRIGIVAPLTGPFADMGGFVTQGVELAVDEINKAGGVGGRMIKLIYRDDESTPDKAVSALKELIIKEKITIVIGSTISPVTFAMLPVINENRILHFSSAISRAIVNPQKNPFTFRANFNQGLLSEAALDYTAKTRGFKRIATLMDNTALGKGPEGEHRARLANKYGLQPVATEWYSPGDIDMTGQLLKIKAANAQVVLVAGLPMDGVRIVKTWKKVGMGDIYLVGQEQMLSRTFRELTGEPIDRCVFATSRAFTYAKGKPAGSKQVEFIKKVLARYGKCQDAMTVAGNYDATYLLAEAIRRADSTDPEKVKTALETIKNFKGVASTASFAPDDHEAYESGSVTIAYPWRIIEEYGDFFERVSDAP